MKWEGVCGVINMWRCAALAPHLCRFVVPPSEGAYLRYSAMVMSQPQQAWNNQTCVSMTTQPPGLNGGLEGGGGGGCVSNNYFGLCGQNMAGGRGWMFGTVDSWQ